jgi:hypothetical protein
MVPPVLTSALDVVEWSPRNLPSIPIGGKAEWGPDPVWSLLRRQKSCHAGNRNPTVQPVARRCTDSAIPTV